MLNRRIFCKSIGILSGSMAIVGPIKAIMHAPERLNFKNLYFKNLKIAYIGNPLKSRDYLTYIHKNAANLNLVGQIPGEATPKIPGVATYTSVAELLNSGIKPDAVLMAGHNIDADAIAFILKNGIDLWTDRPISMNASECHAICELAGQNYCTLLFAFVHNDELHFMNHRKLSLTA